MFSIIELKITIKKYMFLCWALKSHLSKIVASQLSNSGINHWEHILKNLPDKTCPAFCNSS